MVHNIGYWYITIQTLILGGEAPPHKNGCVRESRQSTIIVILEPFPLNMFVRLLEKGPFSVFVYRQLVEYLFYLDPHALVPLTQSCKAVRAYHRHAVSSWDFRDRHIADLHSRLDFYAGLPSNTHLQQTKIMEAKLLSGLKYVSSVACQTNRLVEVQMEGKYVNNELVRVVAKGCSYLRVLKLTRCSEVTDAGALHVALHLSELSVFHCPRSKITAAGMWAVAQMNRGLKDIDVSSCPKMGDAALSAIGAFCPKLEQLDISQPPEMQNEFDEEYYEEIAEITKIWQCGRREGGASRHRYNKAHWSASAQEKPRSFVQERFHPFKSHSGCKIHRQMRDAYYADPTKPITAPLGKVQVRSLIDYNMGVVTDDGLALLARGCPKLRVLKAHRRPLLTMDGINCFRDRLGDKGSLLLTDEENGMTIQIQNEKN